MIRKLQRITSFGVFVDFQWPATLPEFKHYNLIYGWNYSGKTTLSRVFRCFEQKQLPADFPNAQVQIRSDNGTVHQLSVLQTAPLFRVFNSDFVHDNLSFDAGSATPTLVLSAEDIAKQEILKAKKTQRETILSNRDANVTKRSEAEFGIENALTNYARDVIKNPLSKPNYDKRHFGPKVIECKDNPSAHLLDDDLVSQCMAVYRSSDRKPELTRKQISLTPISALRQQAALVLARTVTAQNPIERLKQDSIVENWVNEGRRLHNEKTICQFCEQPLPGDLLAKLAGHFSAEYDGMMAELRDLQTKIKNAKDENIALYSKSDFYPELAERFLNQKNRLGSLFEARKSALDVLSLDLTEKQARAFTSMTGAAVEDPTEQLKAAVETINAIIEEHNNRTAEFEKKREQAFEKLEMHYAATFARDQKYNEVRGQIQGLKDTIAQQGMELAKLDAEIRNLEEATSEASKGAERINELLAEYFGKNDLRIIVSADKRFQIIRGGILAKNLSEGEKTAIAFAHFITRVQDGRHPLSDIRIVIDDPISSLDANHLFNTYALIKTQLAGCRQLFISTHSFEFYNLLKEWADDDEEFKKPQTTWKKWSIFLVKRTDNGKAVLEEIPKELLIFKSEYHYLFSILYHFDKAGGANFDSLLSLPNVIRRFMEAFGGIMIPRSTGLKGKMQRLFANEVERERVWKFINYYSHNTTITRSLTIPDISECKAIVQACLKAVQEWDADYFKDLEEEIS